MNDLFFLLTLVAALGSGLMAGVFFAFSTFVMRALDGLPPGQAVEAMQSTNRAVINPLFLGAFMGTAAVCALLVAASLFHWDEPGSAMMLFGALLYVVGTFLVTVVRNVPMNEALEGVEPTADEAPGHWARYLSRWTAWNHMRSAAALAGAVLLTLSLL